MRILVALGGNALLRRGEPADAATQMQNVELAARGLAEIAAEHELIVTHGNGPQVGLLALQSAAYEAVAPYPLDVLGAESEGMVGYMLDLALHNVLPDREVVTVITEVVVDAQDPAFRSPSKPIGPADPRRLVASPEPRAIVELRSIRTLLDSGALVICAGGGGVPVAVGSDGMLHGVEAVVDKDLTAALLARRLGADIFAMLTDVDGVHLDWGGDGDRRLAAVTPTELREHSFESGSMGPKVEAACRFVEATGGRAAIGGLEDAVEIVRGEAGTQIAPCPARVPSLRS
ncbi:MAG TPA: carbamate kinase [Solirubrobacterales bacterium]|nr:carbamate kinase [Solirubrobacterales bacterium]